MSPSNRLSYPVILALLAVYLAWGGTYLGIRFAVETMPPFLLAGTRFVIVGLLLYSWEMVRGTTRPEKIHWRNATIIGGLLLLGGNSLVVWSEQAVPSGVAALIIATEPLWITLLAWLWQGDAKPNIYVITGLILGFAGQIVLVSSSMQLNSNHSQVFGYIILSLAALFWAIGSLYSRQAQMPKSAIMSIAIQNLMGGMLCLIVGMSVGELGRLNIAHVSTRSLVSFAYLVFAGSIIGYSAYIWVLQKTEPAIASTYAFVNPVIAVFLGWAIANEQLTIRDIMAVIIILASVILITVNSQPKKATSSVIGEADAPLSELDGDGT
jgi:drug/metabolite transporter (DMT)-like permease